MYIDEGTGSPLSAIGKSMSDFANTAASGGFSVNAEGGEALLKAIRNLMAWVDGEYIQLEFLSQPLLLGSSNNAEVMKPYMLDVAVDDRGLLTQLVEFRTALGKAEEGILRAMANYRAADDHIAAGLA